MKKTILLFSTILLLSCGSRKVQRSKTEDKTQIAIVDTSTTKTTDNSAISIIQVDSTNETIIEPIDTAKAMVIDGKTYKNARVKHKKSVYNIAIGIKKNVAKIERKAIKVVAKREMKAQHNKIERKTSYWWLQNQTIKGSKHCCNTANELLVSC